ncbi:MAG: SDR family NAD(P)-dependent oxidoreductase, partial [Ktedonobacteraceae bacterium]|nr:SDR family NAD(P)-dependent oxidoreductase [Ktedonobacteraceae bacterium]
IQERCREEISVREFYHRLHMHGVQLAESFQGIQQLWRGNGEALGKVQLSPVLEPEAEAYNVHPALLDACFQVLIAALPSAEGGGDADALYLPTALGSFCINQQPGKLVWSHALLTSRQGSDVFEGDIRLFDEHGKLLVEAFGLRLQRTETAAASTPRPDLDEQLFYELRWEPAALEQAAPLSQRRTWLIFMDSRGIGEEAVRLLMEQGDLCIKIHHDQTYQVLQQGKQYRLDPGSPEQMQRFVDDLLPIVPSLDGVVHLWSLDAASLGETSGATLDRDQALGTGSALNLVQALASLQGAQQPDLWFVTGGAQAVGLETFPLSVAQSPLWGLGKTCAIEHAELWGGLIDVDPQEVAEVSASQILAVLSRQHNEDHIAFRQGQSYVARLVRPQSKSWTRRELALRADASYLITGGLWGLGLEVARWMIQKGARHLVLLGRTQLPPRADWSMVQTDPRVARQIANIRELEALGAHIHYAPVDVANKALLTAFMQKYRQQGHPPVKGIVHAASVWQDRQGQSLVRPLISLDQAAVKAVFDPKVTGTWNLHKLFQNSSLDFFVLFSSGASLIGSAAQSNYAAAGAFLDAFAHYLRAAGQPAISIDWGAVSGTGFGATPEGQRVHEYWEAHGIQRITPEQVLAALELLIPQQIAQAGVLKLDWQLLRQFYPQQANLPLFAHLTSEAPGDGVAKDIIDATESTLLRRLSAVLVEERLQLVETYLCEKVADVLRLPATNIDVQQPVTTLGLDSLMSIELKNKVELELGIHIPIVTLLQGPSIHQFATQVLAQLEEAVASVEPVPAQSLEAQQAVSRNNDIPGLIDRTEAEQILSQLDQISDDEVDSLLGSLLQSQQEQGNHAEATNGQSLQNVQQLLTNLEQLSDNEVDSLLKHIIQEEGSNQ